MAIKNQRQVTYNIIREYEELVNDLMGYQLQKKPPDQKSLSGFHDRAIQLRKDAERVGLR